MSLSVYQATVPAVLQMFASLSAILKKAEAHAEAKKIEPSVFLSARLAPDMHPLTRQVQIASDNAKGLCARLANVAIPSFPDTEASFADLQARIAKTVDFVKTLKPEQFEGADKREITMKLGPQEVKWTGQVYLFNFGLPNFLFHVTTAYNILRHNGVEIGKRDFIGSF